MPSQFARQTAIPCTLEELKNGMWLQNDGLVPSGVRTSRGMIARASTIGVMVDKRSDAAFSLDDGTSIITVRSFDNNPVPVRADVGDMILVIGRPREYQSERYLVLEVCKKLRNPAWAQYRKRELEAGLRIEESAMRPMNTEAMTPLATVGPGEITGQISIPADSVGGEVKKNPFELLIGKIKELDAGDGADLEDVLSSLLLDGGEKYVRTLIEEGEIFETRPGKVKVLE
jgi:hypothetical protein